MKSFISYLFGEWPTIALMAVCAGLAHVLGGPDMVMLGTVVAAAGYPTGGSAAGSKYTPQIYAKKLLVKFYKKTVFGEIANRDYEGNITGQGDKVIIRTRPSTTVYKYYKGMDLNEKRKALESPTVELIIDQALGYSVAIDDIDKIQNDIDALDEWAQDGSENLGIEMDRDILNTIYADAAATNKGATAGAISGSFNLGATAAPVALTKANILDYIVYCDSVLSENNVPVPDRFIVIPEWAKSLINTSDLRSALFTGDASNQNLRNGKIGGISNFTVYASNNLTAVTDVADGNSQCFNILFGQKHALTFASQLVKNRTLELQNTWGSVMEGLHVYGYNVNKPEALGVLYAKKG